MDGEKLLIDAAKLLADLASGKGEATLAFDVAAAIYDQIGGAKLRQLGEAFIAHAIARAEATSMDSGNPDAPWQGP